MFARNMAMAVCAIPNARFTRILSVSSIAMFLFGLGRRHLRWKQVEQG